MKHYNFRERVGYALNVLLVAGMFYHIWHYGWDWWALFWFVVAGHVIYILTDV